MDTGMSSSLAATDPNAWIALSRDFLAFVEAEEEGSLADLAEKVAALVALAEATELPALSEREPEPPEDVTHDGGWLDRAERRFPALAAWREEDDGYAPDNVGEMAEDLERALKVLDLGHPSHALWEWRFNYESHWGPHHAAPLLAQLALRGVTPTSR